MFLLRKGKIFN
jgi:hypothetical protein